MGVGGARGGLRGPAGNREGLKRTQGAEARMGMRGKGESWRRGRSLVPGVGDKGLLLLLAVAASLLSRSSGTMQMERVSAAGRAWGAAAGGAAAAVGELAVAGRRGGRREEEGGLRLRGGSSQWGNSWASPGATPPKQKQPYNPEQDPEADYPPDDGVTALRFSPAALAPKTYLVSSSWDGSVRCWEVDPSTAKTNPVGMQRHEKSAMCCGWTADGQNILSGGADGKGMMWEIGTGRFTQVAAHDAPIVGIFHAEFPSPCIVTGSWDKTVKFWDPTSQTGQPLGVLQMPERVYAMDVKGSVMVVATAERHILVYDLRNLAQPFRQKFSPLKYQTR
jgi:hypothetical protein